MKKLSKKQEARHDELHTDLAKAYGEMKDAVVEFNDEIARLHATLASKVTKYNDAVIAANEFTQEIHNEQESYYDERSDTWRDGDAGGAYADWMGEWDVELEEVELEEAPSLEEPESEYDSFADLPLEVSS